MSTEVDKSGPRIRVNKAGGGGGGALTIQDEGTVIGVTTILNFVGSQVTAQADVGRINVFVPPPLYSPKYNTGAASVADVSTSNRYVASPTVEGTPYKIGSWVGGTLHDCLNNASINYSSSTFSLETATTTFEAILYDADGVTPLSTNLITIDGNKTVTVQDITITIASYGTEGTKYKCTSSVTFNLAAILPQGGRFQIRIVHHNGGTDYTKTQGPIFYDTNTNPATLTGVTIAETGGGVVTKQISGVWYYDLGSQFTVNIADIDYLNDRSYPLTQVTIDGSEYGLPTLNLQGSGLTGWTNLWDDINDTYQKTDWAITQADFFSLTTTANIASRWIDWVNGGWVNSPDAAVAICTYVSNNTRIYEDFKIEDQRLTSALVSPWDNTQDLKIYDDTQGLQYLGSRLVYPSINFTTYNPNPGSQPNYTTCAGVRTWFRRMWHTGTSHSNGLFRFGDYNIAESDVTSTDIELWISLNGTDWFFCNQLYLGGSLNPGDPCRVNKDIHALNIDNCLEFTLGTGKFTDVTTGGGWGIWIKTYYKAAASGKYVGSFEITNWI